MRRGEVWWGRPPLPGGGKRKKRPFVIVSADAFNTNDRYRKVLVVHLTTVQRAGGPYVWEVSLARGSGGLPSASIAKCAEVYTLLKEHLFELAGTLPSADMHRINHALAVALELR